MLKIRIPKITVKSILPLVNLLMIIVLYILEIDLKYFFSFFTIVTYICLFPRKLFNPKNIVFAYYFIWYCLAPMFANRYKNINMEFGLETVNMAFLMCFVTYAFAMFALELYLGDIDKGGKLAITIGFNSGLRSAKCKREKQYRKLTEVRMGYIPFFAIVILFVIGFIIYVQKTGGLSAWIENPNDAFFNRRGAGMYYILFTHSLLLLLYFEGQKSECNIGDYFRRIVYIGILAISYTFIGSRSTTIMMVLVLIADRALKMDIFDKRSILIVLFGIAVFVVGMFVRLGAIMRVSFRVGLDQILNYFDTFENLLIMLRDIPPGFMQTFFLPLNWPLVKLGITFFSPYYDMSVWMTTVYYPDSWINGGTTQWPMESDMYMSFYFVGGIIFVVLYFAIIANLYKKAQKKGVWQFIYMLECCYIGSHLRGGFLIYWYYWLIPLYIWLVMRYDKHSEEVKIKNKTQTIE